MVFSSCHFPFLSHYFLAGYPVVNDPLYNHEVFGPSKGKGGDIGGKSDEQLVKDLINIHNAENWLGIDGDSELSMFNTKSMGSDLDDSLVGVASKGKHYIAAAAARVSCALDSSTSYLIFPISLIQEIL